MPTQIAALIGLGNPGAEYEHTRHNAGAWFVEQIAKEYGAQLRFDKKFHGLHAKMEVAGEVCHLLIPTTFMNVSGQSVQAFMRFYKLTNKQILIAHDELDMPPGVGKLKVGGGHGGHNGLRDIISKIGTNDFLRLRLGIGHPGDRNRVTDYVLHKPSSSDHNKIDDAVNRACEQIPYLLAGDIDKATRQLHTLTEG